MNRLVCTTSKSICIASFATAKGKTAAPVRQSGFKKKSDAAPKATKKASKTEDSQSQKLVKSLLKHYYRMRTYEAPKLAPEKQEEYEVIAKEYSRQMTILNHTFEQRLNDKIFLRDLAISALPTESLRTQAKKTDPEQIPGKYFYPARKARFEDLTKELAW